MATVAAVARFRRRCSSIATEPITSDIALARPLGSISGTGAVTVAPKEISSEGKLLELLE